MNESMNKINAGYPVLMKCKVGKLSAQLHEFLFSQCLLYVDELVLEKSHVSQIVMLRALPT